MATNQLFVLRHAKSSWDDPGLDDSQRPLAPRGERAAKVIAQHVHDNGIAPTQVLCSPARRARETLDRVAPGGEVLIEPVLYSAGASEIIERLQAVPEEIDSVMVVGHNPALQRLVLRLTRDDGEDPEGRELADIRRKFPTGALATLALDCGWNELGPGRARLTAYVRPKSLA